MFNHIGQIRYKPIDNMSIEEIQKFIHSNKLPDNKYLKISFKKRNPVYGVFVQYKDADELKTKNFWRIVSLTNFKEWQTSQDINLSRIFNGSDFQKLTVE
jgi:hypothetical protein